MKQKVIVSDSIIKNTKDKINVDNGNKVRGYVEIFDKETGENLIGKSNLIVYEARETILQRMLNMNITPGNDDKNLFISWISIGSGGALASDPMNPIAPLLTDTSLITEETLDATNTNYYDNGKKKRFDLVEFEEDGANDNRKLIAKITTTILRTEANGVDINEAGLWLSDSDTATLVNDTKLFSRVTFSSIRKDSNRELILVWYLFF